MVLGYVTKPSTSLRGSLKANKAASGLPPGPFLELLPGCPSVIDYDLEGYAKISHFLSGAAFGPECFIAAADTKRDRSPALVLQTEE